MGRSTGLRRQERATGQTRLMPHSGERMLLVAGRSTHRCVLRTSGTDPNAIPKWEEPTLLARIWEEIRYILLPSRRRF
jgi:hypothetical protein